MEITTKSHARFLFKEAQGFQVHASNGVWGGPNTHGNVEVNFFQDSPLLPSVVLMKAPTTPIGMAIMEQQDFEPAIAEGEAVYVRRMVTGVILTPADAISIGEWLIQNAQAALAVQKYDQAK